jgi:hypothetical protein
LGPSGLFRRVQDADPVERAASDRLGAARAAIAHFGVTVAPVVEGPVVEPVRPQAHRDIEWSAPEAAKVEKKGRGRPKVEGERPWEAAGMSRRTWYRQKAGSGQ